MYKRVVIIGILFALLGVILGAFGAHGLKNSVTADMLSSYETGVRYQMYHAFALIIIGLTSHLKPKAKQLLSWVFSLGILCFSGSIYLLVIQSIGTFSIAGIGFITPIGGLLFIVGWLIFLIKMCIND